MMWYCGSPGVASALRAADSMHSKIPLRLPARAVGGFHVGGGLRGQVGVPIGQVGRLARIRGQVVELGRRAGRFRDVVANRLPVPEPHGLGAAATVVFPVEEVVRFLSGPAEERGDDAETIDVVGRPRAGNLAEG